MKTATIIKQFGSHVMTAEFYREGATIEGREEKKLSYVKMEDRSNLRFPLEWAHTMPWENAHAALQIFEAIGFYKLVGVGL